MVAGMSATGYCKGTTTTYYDENSGTGTEPLEWTWTGEYYEAQEDPCKEIMKTLHIHPYQQEPKKQRFNMVKGIKANPVIFDRKPFLNAYRSARNMVNQ